MTEAAPRGWLSKTLSRLFMKPAVVAQCEQLTDRFRLLTLESPQFRGLDWRAGYKLQIGMGAGLATRTYTPIEWDTEGGRTRILGYAHDSGPGSAWVREVQPGDTCEVFGPRASLDANRARDHAVLFGDETSIGLAHAIAREQPGTTVRSFLEVSASAEVRRVLTGLRLNEVECFEKEHNDSHLSEIEQRLTALVGSGATFLLTGKSLSIQRLHRALKRLGLPGARLATKAYWAPGKAGLD